MATTAPSSTSSPIIRFYDPTLQALDSHHRTLNTILAWDDSELEYCHDYIQWLFPLPERSPIAPSAPVITRSIFNAFRARPELRARMRDALRRICQFYGLDFQGRDGNDRFRIARLGGGVFEARAKTWMTRFNHNHLRITRIIRSLRVLGLEEEARVLFEAVEGVYEETGKISARSLMFWRRAVERPLYMAPEDKEDEGMGKDFLYEFEEERAVKRREEGAKGRLGFSDGVDGAEPSMGGALNGGERSANGDTSSGVSGSDEEEKAEPGKA